MPIIAEHDGPVYMRIGRAEIPDVFDETHIPRIGKGDVLRDGTDLTLIGCGSMVPRCLLAFDALAKEGVQARVISMSSIKPIDDELIQQAAKETGAIVTMEEHTIVGGLGGAVAESLGGSSPVPIEYVGFLDNFSQTGPDPETLMDASGLAVSDIVQAAKCVLARKRTD